MGLFVLLIFFNAIEWYCIGESKNKVGLKQIKKILSISLTTPWYIVLFWIRRFYKWLNLEIFVKSKIERRNFIAFTYPWFSLPPQSLLVLFTEESLVSQYPNFCFNVVMQYLSYVSSYISITSWEDIFTRFTSYRLNDLRRALEKRANDS